ncbi:MAG: SspB family protein [Rhodospirillales bacterium]
MTDGSLPYDQWIEEALRGVIHRSIAHITTNGLPGDHHFYVTFRTDADGVEMAPELRARHPAEMTIVLQHQFWDLEVAADVFAVTLRFQGKPQRLRVPIGAITAFGDPSVNFGLQLKRIVVDHNGDGGPGRPQPTALDRGPDKGGTGEVVTLDNFRKK